MSDEVLERMISSYMATPQEQYIFGWQGGEPTLMGVDFFRRVTQLQEERGKGGTVVSNGLQTNAVLLDDEFSAHLAKYKFLLGVSIDGPEEIHDCYRTTPDGHGSHAAALKGIECLRKTRVEFNALTLVSAANVKHAKEVYRYLSDLGILYHQYVPCVEFDKNGEPQPYAISGEEWGVFLGDIFDEWIKRDTHKISLRTFDSILNLMVMGAPSVCYMGQNCCQYFVVEYNGDVYPCDFFVETPRKLGNIMDDSWEELQQSAKYRAFGGQKTSWNDECSSCKHLKYCAGDCLKHRLYENNDPRKLSWLCAGWKNFYEHSLPNFERLANSIKAKV
jgi:uncharacterized protein